MDSPSIKDLKLIWNIGGIIMSEEINKDVQVEETEEQYPDESELDMRTKDGRGVDGTQEADEPIAKYTDEDIDRIVGEKFAKWQRKKEEEISEAKKLADMNAQEKAEFERDKIQKELEDLRRANALNEMSSTARSMLKESNLDVEDELLNMLVADDAEQTKTNVDSFVSMFNSAVDKAVLDRIKNPNEKRGITSTITKKEIMDIKDSELRQQKIKENIHLFN